ncbi:hypothetical protein [Bacteroides sp.]|uniref:hypothetical protein n=1 Tax=Bacteroides sp. TaxID=29523 RepID=UPI00260D9D3A|nr:hypothetical protein [Bacteroides sp.]
MLRKTALLTVLVSVLFACSDKEAIEEMPESGVNNVSLRVEQSGFTRGVNNQKGAAEYAVLGSGKLYFLNSAYTSIFQRQLTPAEITTLANTTLTPTSGNAVTISGVPSSAQYLYFMANIKTDVGQVFPAVEGTTSTDARLRMDRLQGNAQNVPMSGLSPAFTLSSGNYYTASVEISPIVARLEIGQVTCENVVAGSPISTDIISYKLSGVFINNVNQYVRLDATPYLNNPVNIVNQASWATDYATYFTNNPNFPYYAGGSPSAPSDWTANAFADYCSPAAAGLSFYPDATNGATIVPTVVPKPAWAFQICPSTVPSSGQTTPVGDIPHIILKLTDVQYVANPLGATTLYVVVSKYKDSVTSDNILEFKRGNVYRISNLIFNQTQATGKPYDANITVTCSVTVKPWVINSINPAW